MHWCVRQDVASPSTHFLTLPHPEGGREQKITGAPDVNACQRKIGMAAAYWALCGMQVCRSMKIADMLASAALLWLEWLGGFTFAPDECAHLRALVA